MDTVSEDRPSVFCTCIIHVTMALRDDSSIMSSSSTSVIIISCEEEDGRGDLLK